MTQNHTIFDESAILKFQASWAESQRPVLMLFEGEEIKTRHTLDKQEFIIGREPDCDVVLADGKSSRHHSKIVYRNFDDTRATPKVSVVDLKSTNGTYVNGQRITERELAHRDKIMIGSTVFGFFLHDESIVKAEQRLIELASNDGLTGLRNRAIFDLEIQREFSRARRYGRDLSLVIFDIDHFKKVNDGYGHPVGDQVLREIGNIVAANARLNDFAARYGGEEFVIILPETPLRKAMIQAERLRKAVFDATLGAPTHSLKITISLGMAAMNDSQDKPEDLIQQADLALYAAKRNGRNQIVLHNESAAVDGDSEQTYGAL